MRITPFSSSNLYHNNQICNKQNTVSKTISNPISLETTQNCLAARNVMFTANSQREPSLQCLVSSGLAHLKNHSVLLITPKNNKTELTAKIIQRMKTIDPEISHAAIVEDKDASSTITVLKDNNGKFYLYNPTVFSSIPLINDKQENIKLDSGECIEVTPTEDGFFSYTTSGSEDTCIDFVPVDTYGVYEKYIKHVDLNSIDFEDDTKVVFQKLNNKLKSTKKLKKNMIATKIQTESPQKNKLSSPGFDKIGGMHEEKSQLEEKLIFPIKYPEAFNGIKVNKGILLYGPPGCGKTMLALATSKEADCDFVQINANDLSSMYVGETEKKWRKVFNHAIQNQPCIIFVDEIDAVAKTRQGDSQTNHNDGVVNQILTLLSDLEKSDNQVYVIGATNKKELLDPALLRAGRLGLHIEVTPPDLGAVNEILDIYIKDKKISKDFDKKEFAKKLYQHSFTGADISELVSNAHINALKASGLIEKMRTGTYNANDLKRFVITVNDFEAAFEQKMKQNIDKNKPAPIGFKKQI